MLTKANFIQILIPGMGVGGVGYGAGISAGYGMGASAVPAAPIVTQEVVYEVCGRGTDRKWHRIYDVKVLLSLFYTRIA